jgi:hypothetical protein
MNQNHSRGLVGWLVDWLVGWLAGCPSTKPNKQNQKEAAQQQVASASSLFLFDVIAGLDPLKKQSTGDG